MRQGHEKAVFSYERQTDEELIARLRQGEEEIMDYLMDKYKNLVRSKAKALFLIGGDSDDLIQEGMIGLFKAVRDFRPDRDSSFYHFAQLCIARQMYTAVEASNRKKHAPLNSYVSLYGDDSDGMQMIEMLGSVDESNPENLMINQESLKDFQRKVRMTLSAMEQEVLNYCLQGLQYTQIAEIMGREPKAIDNAIQRIKKKLARGTGG
ncbi:MAG: RNA polymerase sporulation sigma factor SigH [Lachnospiraceae bacterium]|nr:RNA polymerase sporulation sigma factor SigH [Lachnospiraceae bacterium]